jgi:hypothetical protein
VRQQLEKTEQAAIVQLLRTIGASVYVLGTRRRKGDYQGTCQTPGIPDLYCVIRKPHAVSNYLQPVWIEVKAGRGRTSEAQAQFKEESNCACIPHLIGGIDVVTHWLRQGGWIK